MSDFGDRLREMRKGLGLTQSELADQVGVHHQSISNWELGNVIPDIHQFRDLCLYFRCSADNFLSLPNENSEVKFENGSGLKWQVTRPPRTNLSPAREVDDAIEVFRLIAQEGKGFREIQNTKKFAGYGDMRLRHLVKVALFSTAIQLTDVERDSNKEEELREQFDPQLQQCIIAKTTLKADQLIDSTIRTEAVAFLAARDAIASIPNNAHVGLTGGTTIARFTDLLPPASPDLRGIKWLPLLVSQDHDSKAPATSSANSVITRLLYKQPGAEGFRLPFLDAPRRSSDYLKRISGYEQSYVAGAQEVRNLARKVAVAFLSVGTSEYNWQISDAYMGLPSLMDVFDDLSSEEKQQCAGDILLTLVDMAGKRIGSQDSQDENDKIVYSIGLDYLCDIAKFGTVWVLAARSQPGKANVIRGALQAGLINSLVIDTTVADMLLVAPT